MRAGNVRVGLRFRLVLEPDIAIGPGKADLLEGVRATGSIAAAARRLGMSYKRAWRLVDSMNRCFKEPLVVASKGGSTRGGARLTPTGEEVLARYRRIEQLMADAVAAEAAQLRRLLASAPENG
jgi:molybdate transport system regulatory protein